MKEAERCCGRRWGSGGTVGAEHPITAWAEVQLAEVLTERGGRGKRLCWWMLGWGFWRGLARGHRRVVEAEEVAGRLGG